MPVAEKSSPTGGGIDMNGVSSLASLFLGKTTTLQNSGGVATTGSKTTTDSVSQAAIDATVQSILQGTQGLAQVSSGQNRAGLYGTTTNQMLVNDLIARASAEGAKLNKSTTTSVTEGTVDTRKAVTETPAAISPKTAITGVGALQLLGGLSSTGVGKKVLSSLGLGKGTTNAANGSANAGVKAPGGSSDVSGDTVDSSAPDVSTASTNAMGGTSNDVGSVRFGNNPSAFTASDDVSVGSMMQDTPSPDFGTDLSFDQSADFSGFDYAGEGIGAIGDAIGGIGDAAGGDWGVDPGGIEFEDFNTDFADMFNWAEGGLVTKNGNESLIKRKYAGGGYVNLAAEKAFDSGGDEKKSESTDPKYSDKGVDFFKAKGTTAGNDPRAVQSEGDYKPNKSFGVRLIDRMTGRDKKPGYADGGLVNPDITNTGLRAKPVDNAMQLSTVSGDQLVTGIMKNKSGNTQEGGSGTVVGNSGKSIGTRSAGSSRIQRNPGSTHLEGTEGTPGTGVSGTPAENAAAIAGAIGLGISAVTGIPSPVVSQAFSALGIPNSPMSPVSQLVSVISGLVGPDGMTAAANTASAANPSPTASDDNAAMANAIAADNDSDPLDALVGIISDPDDTGFAFGMGSASGGDAPGEGGGIGGTGASAGDGNAGDGGTGGGDGSGSAGGTASAKNGGMIRGPGTATSDSIDAKLSDGEYVIKAAVVDHYGKDFFDRLNGSITVAR